MSEIIWHTPLQFKVVGNFLEIINKKETFRFDDMVQGNPRNKYHFIPVSECSDLWLDNINPDGTLNYGKVVPLKYKTEDEETPLEYDPVELLAEDVGDDGGVVVSVLQNSPALLIGSVVQSLRGVFLVNSVTGAVLAYCILSESVDVSEYLIFAYQGYLLEINNNVRVGSELVFTRSSSLRLIVDSSEANIGDTVIVQGILTNSDGEALVNEEVEVYMNSNLIGSFFTNEFGMISLPYVFLEQSIVRIQLKYNGNAEVDGCESSVKSLVVGNATSIVAEADGLVVLNTSNPALAMYVDEESTDLEAEHDESVEDVEVDEDSNVVLKEVYD